MKEIKQKPLHSDPGLEAGYTVKRRSDGGMHLTFDKITSETLSNWQAFSEEHLLGSDRLTRNLYDLRNLERISQEAVNIATALNSDPTSRNIRLAVVVASEEVRSAIQKVADLTPSGGARIAIFSDMEDAEEWLSRPMASMV